MIGWLVSLVFVDYYLRESGFVTRTNGVLGWVGIQKSLSQAMCHYDLCDLALL